MERSYFVTFGTRNSQSGALHLGNICKVDRTDSGEMTSGELTVDCYRVRKSAVSRGVKRC
jgi:hypothetical protein